MNRLNRLATSASSASHTVRRNWRLLWILVSLGLIALGAGAPDSWEIP